MFIRHRASDRPTGLSKSLFFSSIKIPPSSGLDARNIHTLQYEPLQKVPDPKGKTRGFDMNLKMYPMISNTGFCMEFFVKHLAVYQIGRCFFRALMVLTVL